MYLQQLASGMTLLLSATKRSTKAGTDGEIEKITKTVHVRPLPFLCRVEHVTRKQQAAGHVQRLCCVMSTRNASCMPHGSAAIERCNQAPMPCVTSHDSILPVYWKCVGYRSLS